MSDFLERIKKDAAEAQRRLQDAQQKLAVAQQEFQAAAQESNSYQTIVAVQARKEQEVSGVPAHVGVPTQVTIRMATPRHLVPTPSEPDEETNKTQLVREILRQHPAGMTGGELWNAVKSQFAHRQYVYSVLKRLKKKGDVVQKRKKFVFMAKPEELTQQSSVQ
jgi:hypothetical protein